MKYIFTLLAVSFLFLTVQPLLAQNPDASCACCKEEFRQFDFWLGYWHTYTSGDTIAGTNHIVLLQDSCVIQENWSSARSGYTGTSYNFYNPQTGKWHQTWIDNQGSSLLLTGQLEDGKMVMYSGAMKNQQGQDYINRISWTPNPDGSVRQLWEVSSDDGNKWTAVFDGVYKKE